MKIDKLIKQLELLSDSCESNYALEVNGYTQGVKDSIDVIKNSSLTEVSNQRELLLAVICEYNKINTQKEIIEVEKWIEKWDIKYKNNQ